MNWRSTDGMTRRSFGRLLALGGSAAWLAPSLARGQQDTGPFFSLRSQNPVSPDSSAGRAFRPADAALRGSPAEGERFWESVRAQFLMPPALAVLNAANLCPSPQVVLQRLYDVTRDVDRDPSPNNRAKLAEGKEATRRTLAEYLHATPEEIIITRNTSEANNLVSSGVELKPADEVLIFSDNHPSNHAAWREKAKRFGFTVKVIEQKNPHPGPEYYLDAFTREITPKTKLVAFTHLTSTVGDLFPAKALCRLARERGVLSLVDGAQSFGVMNVDLSDMQPDFFTGSAHKWPCGAREAGVLYVNKAAHGRIWPSIFSAYTGAVGLSRTFEGFGQRDEATIIAFGEALRFQMKIGMPVIEARARELGQAVIAGLKKIDGVKVWTSTDPSRAVAVVSFQPGGLDIRKLSAALYEKDGVGCATRGGADRGGLRFSPHLYNTHAEVERAVGAIRKYMASGV